MLAERINNAVMRLHKLEAHVRPMVWGSIQEIMSELLLVAGDVFEMENKEPRREMAAADFITHRDDNGELCVDPAAMSAVLAEFSATLKALPTAVRPRRRTAFDLVSPAGGE